MATLDINVKVSKEAYELADGIKGLAVAIKTAIADGWDMNSDLPALMSAVIALAPAVQGIDQLDDEAKADIAAFSKALALPLADMIVELIKKAPAADPNAGASA